MQGYCRRQESTSPSSGPTCPSPPSSSSTNLFSSYSSTSTFRNRADDTVFFDIPDPERRPRPPGAAVSTSASPAGQQPGAWRLHFPLPLWGVAGSPGSGGSGPARWPRAFRPGFSPRWNLPRRPALLPGSAREGGSGTQCAGADSLQRRGGAWRGGAKGAGPGEGTRRCRGQS